MALGATAVRLAAGVVLIAACGFAPAAEARRAETARAAPITADQLDQVQRALDEGRLVDAGRFIDQLLLSGSTDPRLHLLAGELGLARGRYDAAISAFRLARSSGALANASMQGEGLALAHLGRRDEAIALLKQVVAADPKAWRAWNALGAEYDTMQAWPDAETAYANAISAAANPARPLNNRGYSRLLQGRLEAAVTDLVASLENQPDLTEARANLRLALALRGEYARAIEGADGGERAMLLNNAGLAAAARGDFPHAEAMLKQAMEAKGEFYQRASDNLKLVRQLASRTQAASDAAR